jgi:hypothetical protein
MGHKLTPQVVEIRFNKGSDTGHNSKTVIPSKFTRLENLEWDKTDTVVQRPGFANQTTTAHTGSPAIVNVRRLHALGEEILLEADTGLHSFLQDRTVSRNTLAANLEQRTFERAQVDYVDIAESQQDQSECDAAVADPSRLECWVWVEPYRNSTSKGVYYRIIDSTSRAVVQSGTVYSTAGDIAQRPRVVVRNGAGGQPSTFYIYYMLTAAGVTDLCVKSISVAFGSKVPGALSAATVMTAGGAHASAIFDAHYDSASDLVVIGLRIVAGGQLALSTYSGADGFTGVATSLAGVAGLAAVSVTAVANGATVYALAIVQYGTNFVYAYSMIALTGGAALTTAVAAPTTPGRLAVLPSPFVTNEAMVFFDYNPYIAPADVFQHDVGYVSCLYNGSAPGTASIFAKSVVLAARPVRYYGTVAGAVDVCVPTALLSDLQPTIFLMKFGGTNNRFGFGASLVAVDHTSPRVLARLFPGECGHLKANYASALRMPTCLAVV